MWLWGHFYLLKHSYYYFKLTRCRVVSICKLQVPKKRLNIAILPVIQRYKNELTKMREVWLVKTKLFFKQLLINFLGRLQKESLTLMSKMLRRLKQQNLLIHIKGLTSSTYKSSLMLWYFKIKGNRSSRLLKNTMHWGRLWILVLKSNHFSNNILVWKSKCTSTC